MGCRGWLLGLVWGAGAARTAWFFHFRVSILHCLPFPIENLPTSLAVVLCLPACLPACLQGGGQ